MGKAKRGKNLKKTANWRGTCPVCNRGRVKLLWVALNEDKKEIKCCKLCGK